MLNILPLAMRLLWREGRSGEWWIVLFALFLAVAATTTLHFYTDRLMRGFDQQGAILLGGDLVISSPTPLPPIWTRHAHKLGLRTAEVWSYPSMVGAHQQLQLVNLQAVSDTYPLVGELHLPAGKTIWVEPRLLSLLSSKLQDRITIGAANFTIAHVLSGNMDLLNTGWLIAPRVLMRLSDVPATRTVLPGSRVDYRLLMVGNSHQLQQFYRWVAQRLTPEQRLMSVRSQQFGLQNDLKLAENYLHLVLLICLLMSGVAIALSIRQYLQRHYAHAALWRCLGARKQQLMQIFLWQLFLLALIAGLLGVSMGYLTQNLFAELFKDLFAFPLPLPSFAPIGLGFLTSVLLLFGLAYPVISELPYVSPVYLWRGVLSIRAARNAAYLISASLAMLGLLYGMMGWSLLALFFMACTALSMACLYALSLFLLFLLRYILDHTEGVVRRGLSEMIHHADSVSIQFVCFTLLIMALLTLGFIRGDLIHTWQKSLPEKTPNYFLVNIAPADLSALTKLLVHYHLAVEDIYPIVRGRFIALNGRPILQAVRLSAERHNVLHRQLNLTWMWQFPADNKIVQGTTWQEKINQPGLVSVEKTMADDLGLYLGDRVTFQIGDQTISAVITNMRKLSWTSFHPNFYFIFSPGSLPEEEVTYITSLYLPENQLGLLNELNQTFPNISVIDVANVLKQIQALVSKIMLGINYLFIFIIAASLLVLITSIQATVDERKKTYHLLRVLGASQQYIQRSIIVEGLSLATCIILAGYGMAQGIAFILMRNFFV